MPIFIPVSLALGILAYVLLFFVDNRMVLLATSIITPIAILNFVALGDLRLSAIVIGGFCLLALLLLVIVRLRPWPLILPALIVTGLAGSFLLMMFVGALFRGDDFGEGTDPHELELYELSSPDGRWRLHAEENNQGALGGDFYLKVGRRYFFGLIEYERTIYFHGFGVRPKVAWLNNRTVSIDNHRLDILDDPMLNGRNLENL
jgi:hypothetical protein